VPVVGRIERRTNNRPEEAWPGGVLVPRLFITTGAEMAAAAVAAAVHRRVRGGMGA